MVFRQQFSTSRFLGLIYFYKCIEPGIGVNKTALWLCFKGADKSLLRRVA